MHINEENKKKLYIIDEKLKNDQISLKKLCTVI